MTISSKLGMIDAGCTSRVPKAKGDTGGGVVLSLHPSVRRPAAARNIKAEDLTVESIAYGFDRSAIAGFWRWPR
jgi:hypothetical protein